MAAKEDPGYAVPDKFCDPYPLDPFNIVRRVTRQLARENVVVDRSESTYRARKGTSCLGNAVVPQVAQWIGERIMAAAAE